MIVAPEIVTLKDRRQITLRSATPADAGNFLEHLVIAHTESYRNINHTGEHWKNFPLAEEQKILAACEESPYRLMLLALHEGRAVGGLGLFGYMGDLVKTSASLAMTIQQAFCGSGLGTAMMTVALQQAKQAGFRHIYLTVRTYNEAGIRLYEKMGFERVGLLKDTAHIDGEYVSEYSYQKILQ